MQPKIPRRLSKPNIWSHNTSYVGISGKHSENSPGALARNTNIDNRLNKVVSALKEMERKQYQNLEKSKREIQNSMLAYTDRVRQINADRYLNLHTDTTDTSPQLSSRNSSNGTRYSTPPTDRSTLSYNSHVSSSKKGKITPMKNRRISLPKLTPQRKVSNSRRLSSVSDSVVMVKQKHSSLRDNKNIHQSSFNVSDDILKRSAENSHRNDDLEFGDIRISPFPYDSNGFDPTPSQLNTDRTSAKTSPIPTRKRISYKQYREEKELERERMQMRRKVAVEEEDPFEHHKRAILRQEAENRRAALLLEKARQEALKNKKDICNTFSYSFAMEELLKKSNPLRFQASEKDFISKVEVDKDGTIKQTLGPAVLAIIGVDELNNYHGMRIKWSAKYRQNHSAETEQSGEDSFLPQISEGEDMHSISRQVTREPSETNLDDVYSETKSSISAVSVDG